MDDAERIARELIANAHVRVVNEPHYSREVARIAAALRCYGDVRAAAAEAERDRLQEACELVEKRIVNQVDVINEERANAAAAAAERDRLRAATKLCELHTPVGTRSSCLVCSMVQLCAALSAIDYACGEPNEQKVSDYDLHCDAQAVVKRVEGLKAERDSAMQTIDCLSYEVLDLKARVVELEAAPRRLDPS